MLTRSIEQGPLEALLHISKEELDRRMRVFGGNHFGVAPTINLHGVEFRAVV